MNGTDYLLIVLVLVVLMFNNKIDIHLERVG